MILQIIGKKMYAKIKSTVEKFTYRSIAGRAHNLHIKNINRIVVIPIGNICITTIDSSLVLKPIDSNNSFLVSKNRRLSRS